MITATLLIGVSGSGKSTVLDNKFKDANVCSTDKYVDDYADDRGLGYSDAFDKIQEDNLFKDFTRLFYIDIETCIREGVDFIVDRTNLTIGARKALIGTINGIAEKWNTEVKINGIWFDIPKKVVKERLENRLKETGKSIPEDVIDNQFEAFEKPTSEEFAHLTIVTAESNKSGRYEM